MHVCLVRIPLARLKNGPLPTPSSKMYTTYFQHRPRGSPVEWTSDCPETTILDTYLSAQIDAKTAAKRLTPPAQDPTGKVGDKQWRLWNLIFDVAAELPQTQPDLVVLLEAFGTLENPGDWAVDWSRLGSFGSVWRDAWEGACPFPSRSVLSSLSSFLLKSATPFSFLNPPPGYLTSTSLKPLAHTATQRALGQLQRLLGTPGHGVRW